MVASKHPKVFERRKYMIVTTVIDPEEASKGDMFDNYGWMYQKYNISRSHSRL